MGDSRGVGHETGTPVTITKRGRIVATLQPAGDQDEKPWPRLRGTIREYREPFKPATESLLRDPADRLIVATSRILGAPILTRDHRILRSHLAKTWALS